jgi:hypothetical protein
VDGHAFHPQALNRKKLIAQQGFYHKPRNGVRPVSKKQHSQGNSGAENRHGTHKAQAAEKLRPRAGIPRQKKLFRPRNKLSKKADDVGKILRVPKDKIKRKARSQSGGGPEQD